MILAAGNALAIEVPISPDYISLNQDIEILSDPEGIISFEDIRNGSFDGEFLSGDPSNRGVANGFFWLRFKAKAESDYPMDRYIAIENPYIHDIQFYFPSGDGAYEVLDLSNMGFHDRPVVHRFPTLPLVIYPDVEHEYYLRVNIRGAFIAPLTMWNPHDYREYSSGELLILGMIFGGLVVMVLYHAFMVYVARDFLYGYYVLFLVGAIFFELHIKGMAHYLFWMANPALYLPFSTLSLGLMIAFSVMFARRFIESRRFIPKTDFGLAALVVVSFAMAILGFTKRIEVNYLTYFVAISWSIFLLYTTFYAWLGARLKRARFLAFAWTGMLLGVIGVSLVNLLGLRNDFLVTYLGDAGLLFSVTVFGLALADRTKLKAAYMQERLQEEVDTLEGLLPICDSCKKIRTDEGEWDQMELYIRGRADVEFSHSYCPTCVENNPDFFDLSKN